MFFTATAAAIGHVNVSPRSTDMLRVLGDQAVMYLDRTGSGNETAAHLGANGRLTMMFCAVDGPPLIMRLYGKGRVIHRESAEFSERLQQLYEAQAPLGARQMIHLDIDLVQTSCGYGVPLFDYRHERPQMDAWARAKGPDGIEAYWREKNRVSIDGLATGLFDPSPKAVDGPRVRALNHITLAVGDLPRSLGFYRDVLGFALRAEWPQGAYLEAGDLWLCLTLDEQAQTAPHPDYTHIALDVAAADFETLSERIGATATIWKSNRSEGDSLYFLDPDGHKLELHVGTLATRLQHYRQRPVPGRIVYEG